MATTREQTDLIVSDEMTRTWNDLARRTSGVTVEDSGTAQWLASFADLGATRSILGPAFLLAYGSSPTERPALRALTAGEIVAALDAEPFESGVAHPFEPRLAAALRASSTGLARCVAEVIATRGDLHADLLRCIGRLPEHLAFEPLHGFMTEGLRSPSLRLRDAAVRALETWGSEEAREILRRHDEPVPWLRDYIRRVLG